MNQGEKINLDDMEDYAQFFPMPFVKLIHLFKEEFKLAIRAIVSKLDLVSKQDYLVQQRMLDEAYKELKQLKEQCHCEQLSEE